MSKDPKELTFWKSITDKVWAMRNGQQRRHWSLSNCWQYIVTWILFKKLVVKRWHRVAFAGSFPLNTSKYPVNNSIDNHKWEMRNEKCKAKDGITALSSLGFLFISHRSQTGHQGGLPPTRKQQRPQTKQTNKNICSLQWKDQESDSLLDTSLGEPLHSPTQGTVGSVSHSHCCEAGRRDISFDPNLSQWQTGSTAAAETK